MGNMVGFRLDPEVMATLREVAEEAGMTPTQLCRVWIVEKIGAGDARAPRVVVELDKATEALAKVRVLITGMART